MKLTESSIKYPITVIVRVLLVAVFGYVCVTFLDVELKPDTSPPVLAIITEFPGAAPEEVEGEVTNKFEQYVSGVSNLLATFGYCYYGQSFIFALYHPGTNLDLAAAELERNLQRVQDLPDEVQKPQILKATDFVNFPVYQFSMTGNVDRVNMTTWGNLEIAPSIKRISGVGDCQFRGARTRQMRISFDPERLKARHLTVSEIKTFIDRSNLNRSAGYFVNGPMEWTVRVIGELKDADAFGKVIISKPGEPPVYLSDVATIKDMYQRPDSDCRIDGKSGLVFSVYNEADANIVKLIESVDKELHRLQGQYGPMGIKFNRLYDQSIFIRDAVDIVKGCLIQAAVLILLVLLVFLKRVRSILIVALSIPVSLTGTFIGMYLFGYSINVISLAGLALAIGMIVDDSIVVLENIFRHRYEEGKDRFRACVDGTREVGMAAFMSTLTIAAVFVPVLMLKGEVGTLFGPVAFVVSFAIFVSLLDAFTVVPMLAFRWMKDETDPSENFRIISAVSAALDRIGSSFASGVNATLRFFLGHGLRKAILILAVVGVFAVSCWILPGFSYLPTGGSGLVQVNIECVQGTSLEQKNRMMKVLEERWSKIEGVRHVISAPDRNMFRNQIYLVCKDARDSGVPITKIAKQASETAQDMPFRSVDTIRFPLFGNIYLRSNVVDFRIVGKNFEVIRDLVQQMMDIGASTKGVVFRYTDLSLHKPEIDVRIDRERAQNLGFQVKDIADAVEAAVGGRRTKTQYDVADHYFYVRIMGDEQDVDSLEDVRNILLTSPTMPGTQVPLSSVASVEPSYGPLHITHFNGRRSARVQFTVEGRALNDVFHEVVSKMKANIDFPHGYAALPFGSINQLHRLSDAMRFVFPLSAVVVYLLLVMQFQSFVRPLAIMLSVPLSLIGANFVVRYMGVPFDAFTMLGYIMMVGLVVKNSILLITYTVELTNRQGVECDRALSLAVQRRMRPIFMTSIAMIFGMLPLAMTTGPAAEIYNGLATVVVAGLAVSSLVTLIFIPVVYTVLEDIRRRFRRGTLTTAELLEADGTTPEGTPEEQS
jgi:hydrophobic/amphiphilic exporter-1 (mainly G- bacteria), HAE1 family